MQIHFNLSIFFYHKRAMESLMLTKQVFTIKKTYNELVGNRTIQFLLSISRSFIRSIRELQLETSSTHAKARTFSTQVCFV